MDEYPIVTTPTNDEILPEEEYEKLYTASFEIIILLSLFYGSISAMAIVGNTLVIWIVATTRQMRTVTNMYIANLALADVIIGLFCIPFQFQAALLQRWNLPEFMCAFCPFVQVVSVNVSVFTLTAIAIDRHRAIINPLRARPTKFLSKIVILTIWVLSLAFAVPIAIAFRVEVLEERIRETFFLFPAEDDLIFNVTRPFCTNLNLTDDQLRMYRYLLVFVQYLVPFCVISFVYIQMAVKLWGTQTPGNAQDARDITLMRNKKKVIKMLIIVVVVFGVCWMPLQLYNILYVTIPEINEYHFINIIWFCCDWLAMSNSCYNPFIYGIYNEKFKREFNKRFSMCFCKFATNLDNHDRSTSVQTRASSIRSSHATSSTRIRNNIFGSQQHLKLLPSGDSFRKQQNHQTHFHCDNDDVIVKRNEKNTSLNYKNYDSVITFTESRHKNSKKSFINVKSLNRNNSNSGCRNNWNNNERNCNKDRKSLTFCDINDFAKKDDYSHGTDNCLWERNSFKPCCTDLIEVENSDNTAAMVVTLAKATIIFPASLANLNNGIRKKAAMKNGNNDLVEDVLKTGESNELFHDAQRQDPLKNEASSLRNCFSAEINGHK